MSGKMEVWLLDLGTLYAKQEGIICRGWPQDFRSAAPAIRPAFPSAPI